MQCVNAISRRLLLKQSGVITDHGYRRPLVWGVIVETEAHPQDAPTYQRCRHCNEIRPNSNVMLTGAH
jgi:hypothetical protein